MRIATWNVNSLNARQSHVLDWLAGTPVDVLCLQELKLADDKFPHEELAQALGPLNDLYRLSDSVFNDDNFQSVLTSFDMDILRMTYSPSLSSGMSREEVAARLGTSAALGPYKNV